MTGKGEIENYLEIEIETGRIVAQRVDGVVTESATATVEQNYKIPARKSLDMAKVAEAEAWSRKLAEAVSY